MYKIYAILHSFYHKRTFSNFWRNGPQTLENQEISVIFCHTCLQYITIPTTILFHFLQQLSVNMQTCVARRAPTPPNQSITRRGRCAGAGCVDR